MRHQPSLHEHTLDQRNSASQRGVVQEQGLGEGEQRSTRQNSKPVYSSRQSDTNTTQDL